MSSKNLLTSLAMVGTMRMKFPSCRKSDGTRKTRASATSPIKARNVIKIASPLGITRERARTGKESTIASAIPPKATMGMIGAA